MPSLLAWMLLLRPSHWIKNVFVLAGFFFSGDWRNAEILTRSLAGFAVFCLASSAVYCLNDALDADKDRQHPRKRLRPVAAGLVSRRAALTSAALLLVPALALALWTGPGLAIIAGAYLAVNLAYSSGWKNKVLVDVFCIASGFILRLLAGTWGIGIEPSQWFLLCTMALSLFLGFSKRYAELAEAKLTLDEKRAVLRNYSPEFLRMLMGVTLSATLITYGLYTTSARTVAVHGTSNLVYTLPIAMFAMFRYLYLVMEKGFGENTVAEVLKDRQLLLATAAYLVSAGGLLFL